MNEDTKGLLFIAFIIALIVVSAYSAISSAPASGNFGGEFADVDRARKDTPDKKREGASLIISVEERNYG